MRKREGLLAHRLPIREALSVYGRWPQLVSHQPSAISQSAHPPVSPGQSSNSLVTVCCCVQAAGGDAESRRRPAPAKTGELSSLGSSADDETNGLGGALQALPVQALG